MTLFNYVNPAEPFQGGSLLITSKSPAFSSTDLTDLTMKTTRSFEPEVPGLVIDSHY